MTLQIPKPISALMVILCAAVTAVAQQLSAPEPQPATVIGTVLDITGAVVPGATVLLECRNRNDDYRVVAQNTGFFKLDSVNPATPCHVNVTAEGFAKWTSKEIVLTASQYFILTGI